ncbi:MAG: uracil-DNA glycosylase family protein [Rhodospirillales bacterium]|jgi:uracil-DNA glycosylase
MAGLNSLLKDIRACRICEQHLPLGPNPVIRASKSAKILIIGQAPGTKVHNTGLSWNDASGDRLRDWMQVDRETFYDESRVAVMPMGLCYPGRQSKGGDKPPRPECAPQWHDPVRKQLSNVELIFLVGSYAQKYYLGKHRKKTMTETIKDWRDYLPEYILTPHPSWRTTFWLKENPWFEKDVLPELRKRVKKLLKT